MDAGQQASGMKLAPCQYQSGPKAGTLRQNTMAKTTRAAYTPLLQAPLPSRAVAPSALRPGKTLDSGLENLYVSFSV